MTNIEHTKQLILRAVVQANIRDAQGIKHKSTPRLKRAFPSWRWSFPLTMGLVSLLVPPYVVSTGTALREKVTEPLPAIKAATLTPDIPLSAPQPLNFTMFPLSVKKIALDPGHGGEEPGAVSESGVAEKEITLNIALRLRQLMQAAPFEVLLTRDKDRSVPLSERAAFANRHGADIFVSLHVNWVKAPGIRPLETYYLGPTDDPITMQLASRENRDSDHSLGEFRRLLEKIYLDGRRSESRNLANTVHVELFQSLSQINPLLENRGVKTAPFAVLVGTEMPAILVEISCLSNNDELRLLSTPDYQEQIARSLFEGIRSYANGLNVYARRGN